MRGKKVLIVDDEAPLRFMLSKQLNRAGFETTTAGDGETALALAAGAPFDAIVLDVVMPGMDGFEVCRRLKAETLTADVPVLFLSASCSGEFRRRAFRVGAADFLAKPFEIEELPAYLQAILRRREDTTQATGQVVTVIGAGRAATSGATALRLAKTAALQGPGPAMLIDLELPAGSIGARLQLSGGPNMRVLLQDSGEPLDRAAIDRVAQRYHGALEVMPAPYTPALIQQGDPLPERLADTLALLRDEGYYVVVHLGTRVDALTLTALHNAETVWADTDGATNDEHETLLDALTAAGIADERIVATRVEHSTRPTPAKNARERKAIRSKEPAVGVLAPAL
ncbi:putative Response regulator receiver protein [Candidatus Promineifilum breve]|uniref:Response regulator receiver protein n=1 Tax=Candidatus Promineifilum breve TaxID=1806508 RepID=A0A170PIA1_9CHLR|nr:response regulator [Candidatus Promineifilum breve]CUS04717.2 putative Response regulator receiver protein [Candidatus Promineifilum breve]